MQDKAYLNTSYTITPIRAKKNVNHIQNTAASYLPVLLLNVASSHLPDPLISFTHNL